MKKPAETTFLGCDGLMDLFVPDARDIPVGLSQSGFCTNARAATIKCLPLRVRSFIGPERHCCHLFPRLVAACANCEPITYSELTQ